ncbi:MAG: hypothetical protein HW403_440 [Dehalococcoidia bacterium]|nr:hypothetical protein [Dehalococcoidia bacterium]
MTELLGAQESPILDYEVLIDVPPKAKFAADVKGVYVEGADESPKVLDWESTPQPSYFTRETVAAMEQRLRNILYICNVDRPLGRELQRALRTHPELL